MSITLINKNLGCTEPSLYSLKTMKSKAVKLDKIQLTPITNKNVLIEKTQQFSDTTISRSIMIDRLIDIASDIIDSIWSNSNAKSNPKVMSSSCFIKEILKRSKATFSILQLALFYLFRVKKSIYNYAQQNPQSEYKGYVSCGRRMFLAALMVSSKYLNDKNYQNKTWAKIACLDIQEINKTEFIFLKLIQYQLYVSKPLYDKWVDLLHHHIQKKDLICKHILEQQHNSVLTEKQHSHSFVTDTQHIYTNPNSSPSSSKLSKTSPISSCHSDTSSPDNTSLISTPITPALTFSKKRPWSVSIQDNETHTMNKHLKIV